MAAHVCETCGLMHDAVTPQESEAVTLARIAKEQAVEVAKINARTERDWNETRVQVAELEADAEVGAAEAEAEVLGTLLTAGTELADEPEPEPIVIDAPALEETEINDDAPPPADEHSPHEPREPRKSRGLGMW